MDRRVHKLRLKERRRRRHGRRRDCRHRAHLNLRRLWRHSELRRLERSIERDRPRWWKRLRRALLPFRPKPVHIAGEAVEENARWTLLGPPDLADGTEPAGPSPPL